MIDTHPKAEDMTSTAQSPQKVGGSFFLTIPPAMRDGLEGGEAMQWASLRPGTYAITSQQDGNSRTLKQGRSMKIRVPRETIMTHGTGTQWTMRQEGRQLIAEAAEGEHADPIKAGDVISTEQGPAVVVRTETAGQRRTLCAYLTTCAPTEEDALILDGDEWGAFRVDLTAFVVKASESRSRTGRLDRASLKAINEAIAPLF